MPSPTMPSIRTPLEESGGLPARPGVILFGLATTAAALAGVWFAGQHDVNIMGWYANYVIPAGAILVGLAASSGYGLGSYVTGTKVSGRLLVLVLALLTASYFAAKYIEFRLAFPQGTTLDDGQELAFWQYFDLTTRSIYWKAQHSGEADGKPLGLWGFGLRALEVIGFVGGGAIIPFALRKLPYCAACKAYKRTRQVAHFAAGVPVRKIKKKDLQGAALYQAEQQAAWAQGETRLNTLLSAAAKADAAALADEVKRLPKLGNRAAQKITARIAVSLVHCPRCREGTVKAAKVTGQGKQVVRSELLEQPMDRMAVMDLLGRLAKK